MSNEPDDTEGAASEDAGSGTSAEQPDGGAIQDESGSIQTDEETDGQSQFVYEDENEPEREETTAPVDHSTRDEMLADVREYLHTQADTSFAPAPDDEFINEHWFDFSYLDEYREVERRWVSRPFAFVTVVEDESENEYLYHIVEPKLDGFEQYVRKDLIRLLRNSLMYQDLDEGEDREAVFTRKAKELIADHAATVESGSLHKLLYYLIRDFVYLGPIDPVMRDPDIEDISCDGVDIPVFVYHREHRDLETNVTFGKEALSSFTVRLAQRAGKQISVSEPLMDGSLPDGSRVQLTFGSDISTRGSNFTIRKFADIPYTPIDMIDFGTFTVEQMAYFWLAIESNRSLIFAGGTGSGKTTSMNAVSFFIPPNSKVVSIEDTREITLPHDNWVQSVTRDSITAEGRGAVSMYELLQAALRQRPEYILVGEIRTEQDVALTFFQAIGTGHTAYTTVHAESVEGVLNRLENPPLSVPTQMIQDLDIISIQTQTLQEGERVRRNQEVTELLPPGQGDESVRASEVYRRDAETDSHQKVNDSEVLDNIASDRGWSGGRLAREIQERETVLEYLLENGFNGYDDVTNVLHTYAKDPETVIDEIEAGTLDPADLEA